VNDLGLAKTLRYIFENYLGHVLSLVDLGKKLTRISLGCAVWYCFLTITTLLPSTIKTAPVVGKEDRAARAG
jgi:hypothetical protein